MMAVQGDPERGHMMNKQLSDWCYGKQQQCVWEVTKCVLAVLKACWYVWRLPSSLPLN